MSRVVYSAKLRLVHALVLDSFVVPTDQVWVVRTCTLFYPGAVGTSDYQLVDLATSSTLIKDSAGSLSGGAWHVLNDLRIVLEPGDGLQQTGEGDPDVGLYGYSFVLPPPSS